MRRKWSGPACRWALAIWVAGVVVAGLFPAAPSGRWGQPPIFGVIHGVAALTALTIFSVAAAVVSRTCGHPALRVVAGTSVLATAALAILLGHAPALAGIAERTALATNLLWLILAAANTSKAMCPRPSGCGSDAPAGTGRGRERPGQKV